MITIFRRVARSLARQATTALQIFSAQTSQLFPLPVFSPIGVAQLPHSPSLILWILIILAYKVSKSSQRNVTNNPLLFSTFLGILLYLQILLISAYRKCTSSNPTITNENENVLLGREYRPEPQNVVEQR